MLNRYKFILGTIFYMGVQYISHAEQINFQGSISEFTCTHQSKDPLCQNIQIALSNIKTKQDNRNNESYKKSDHVSNIIEQNLDQHHKIIILSYH